MSKYFVDYYKLLGVKRNASDRAIRKAYGEKLKYYEGKEKDLHLLARAYAVLSDEDEREMYDRELEDREVQYEFVEETLKEEIVRSYHEVKEDEKRSKGRHRKFSKQFDELHNMDEQTGIDEVVLKTKKGVLHVFGECFHQLNKLTFAAEDGPVKYVIRNRGFIAGLIIAGGLFIGIKSFTGDKTDTGAQTGPQPVPYEIVRIDRRYEVQRGDTLWGVSNEFDKSMEEIKGINPVIRGTGLVEGTVIYIPYNIEKTSLDKHVMTIQTEGLNIDELAKKYETDRHTLMELNEDAFYFDEEDQTLKTDETFIKVPTFVAEKKESSAIQYKRI